MTAKILLTGGAGYIGSHTYCALIEAGFDVVMIDDFSNAQTSVLTRLGQITGVNQVQCYEGSVLDRPLLDRIFSEHKIDAVVHFAAFKAVGESTQIPIDYFQTNIGGLLTLLQAMKAANVMRLVFSSSATVYGEPDIVPTPETAPRQYQNPYGYTKIAGEQILEQAAAADPWAFGILRYFNPVGAHPSGMIGEDPSDIPNNLMPYIAKVATGELPHLNVFGDDYDTRDGTGERDYVHVMDLARGHVLSLQSLLNTNQGHLVNLGTGQAYSVLEMNAAYSQACGKDLPYVIAPRRPGDVPIYQADVSKARDILGFETKYDLQDMCASSWHWIETHGAHKS
ncbi:MAG: UDP-glucose 4-epimerase GalE [Pseudomonadota bacterium]